MQIDDQYRNILSAYKLDSVLEDDYNKAIKEGRINQKFIDAAREFMIQDDKGNWKFKEDLRSDNIYHGFLENIRGLLCQGKTSYDSINEMSDDPEYYKLALGITRAIPSAETLCQRMDDIGSSLREEILNANVAMFNTFHVQPSDLLLKTGNCVP